ncbi:Proline and serine-rich protein 2 [Bagarius yarrelli]|uniref:Proline and serine-rich protein 2 n=1 Tax=Bagarius yarrelli TaxID=175774 RepID=A0A556TI54_BAGYA|nr:Proline and serine-rich protein 2 [Bagarius yarrelli]
MDIHVYGKARHSYKLNGYQQAKDDGLQFLSVEEKECILFFEETIDSLEEGFETKGLTSQRSTPPGSLQTLSSPSPVLAEKVSPSLMENDIIDLVRSPSHSALNYTNPDFQNSTVTPDLHYETLPNKDLIAGVPSMTKSLDVYEENDHHPPPGSVPTPVVIASKIAENQGTGGITPSKLLGHGRSLEPKRDPALSARTARLPSKISITQGKRESSPHSIATAAVNIQERRSQMLANLPAGSHPLEGGEPDCIRNLPTRQVSFKDMEPEKSRIEALNKLGLLGGKTSNLTASSLITKGSSSPTSPISSLNKGDRSSTSPISNLNNGGSNSTSSNSSAYKGSSSPTSLISNFNRGSGNTTSPISSPYKVNTSDILARTSATKVNVNTQSNLNTSSTFGSSNSYDPKSRSEVSSNCFNYFGGKSVAITPMTKDKAAFDNQERMSSNLPLSAEMKPTDFNSYGGKSMVLNPTKSAKVEPVFSPSANTSEPSETHFNSYGGRSRVMNPLVNTDVPEGVDLAQSHLPANAVTPTTHHHDPTTSRLASDQTSYESKPKVPTGLQSDLVYQALVRTRPTTQTASRLHTVPPEILGKPVPSFRNQGITVQFSGKGTTGEARRDALRRLGLLKNTS